MPRLLMVRLGAIGDIVHAVPVAAALARRWPGVRLDWLVERRHRSLLDLVPCVAPIEFDSRRLGGAGGWGRVVRAMRRCGYDAAIDVQGLLKSALLARASGAARVIGFSRAHVRERAAAWFYTEPVDVAGAVHVVDRNLALLRPLGIASAAREFPLELPMPADRVLEAVEEMRGPFVLLNAGGNWPNKRWPPERFGAVASLVRERAGVRSMVLWGPDDGPLAEAVVAASGGAAGRAPRTSLVDVMHLAKAAEALVSGDTGPIHLAAAVGTPVVGIYGPTDPVRNGPWNPGDVSVSRRARCECYHQRRCRAREWCLLDVEPEEVASAVLGRLRAQRGTVS
jgi:heptosyltransferase I